MFRADGAALTLHACASPRTSTWPGSRSTRPGRARRRDAAWPARCAGVVLESAADGPPARGPGRGGAGAVRRARCSSGGRWLPQSTYPGRWRETLQRSAITLKLMTYAPTGGLVAAPTAGSARAGRRRAQLGLPLHLGARRLVLGLRAAGHGLHRGGRGVLRLAARPHPGEGRRRERAAQHHVPRRRLLGPQGGGLEHWEGYRGSRPVRIGNGATDQLQMDIYGEAMDSIYFADQRGLAGRPRRAGCDLRACSTGWPTTGTSRRRASGRPAAAARTSPTAG